MSISKSVHFEKGKGLVIGPTKTKTNRVVPLRQRTVDALRQQKARLGRLRLKAGPAWEDGDFVFATGFGKPIDSGFLQRRFDLACAAAGIRRRMLKETRHTFATLGLVDRVPVKIIQEALGHASVAITYDVYSHVIAGLEEDALAHLDDLFV